MLSRTMKDLDFFRGPSVMDLDSKEECTVSGALALALRMSRLAGVAPLKFRRARAGWRVRVSEDLHLYGQTLSVILCLVTLAVLLTDLLVDPDGVERMDTDEFLALTFIAFVMMTLLTLGGAFTGRQRMSDMIESLNQVQKISLKLNYYRQCKAAEKKKWLMLIVTVFGGFFLMFINYVLTLCDNIKKHGKLVIGVAYIFHEFLGGIHILLNIQYVLTVFTILTTLEQLNGCLEDFLAEIKSDDVRETDSKLIPEAVDDLSYLMCGVSEAVRRVDSSHGLVALLLITLSIFNLLYTLYNIIETCFQNNGHCNPSMQLIWTITHFSQMLVMVEPCHRTQEEMMKTKELVSKLMLGASPSGALAEELTRFYRQLALDNTAYCPMDMFTINRQLIVTICSTITTYLVIVEQL